MEISEIRDRRDQLEKDIRQLIIAFIGETEVDISEIEFNPREKLLAPNPKERGFITTGIIEVTVKVELDT